MERSLRCLLSTVAVQVAVTATISWSDTAAGATTTTATTAIVVTTPSRRCALLCFLGPDLDCRPFQRLVEDVVT